MNRKLLVAALILLAATGLTVVGHAADKAEPLAEVDGVAITAEDVERPLGGALTRLQEQMYSLKRQKMEAIIAERLLAKEAAKRGVTVPALLDAEVTSKVGLVTEQEVETFYQTNKDRLQGDEASARAQIRAYLQAQILAARREAFLGSLRAQATVVVHMKPPPAFRAEVAVAGAPFKGPAQAPVTIVKFEDFHCSFCKGAQATLAELESRYTGKVKVVHRDFPIDQLHPQARKLHEAARCASEQGRFWAYHDALYTRMPVKPEEVKTVAREVGLDLPAFEQCLAGDKYQAAVQKDVEEGTRAGVTGTPAFFINGRLIEGAQPLESFARVIDEELAKAP
jgi:protein-disulfide isomerase